jgi:hypothetical protein
MNEAIITSARERLQAAHTTKKLTFDNALDGGNERARAFGERFNLCTRPVLGEGVGLCPCAVSAPNTIIRRERNRREAITFDAYRRSS